MGRRRLRHAMRELGEQTPRPRFGALRKGISAGDGYLRRNVIARSSSHVESSRDNFQRPSIVSPSALSFPLNFCEKPGECRHILQTPSLKLTW
jgi:hypothetical protein